MRGKQISKASQKLDVVLVSARYDPGMRKLEFAQGYVRRGKIWGDQKLINRAEIIEYVEKGKRIVTGKPGVMPGDFVAFSPVKVEGEGSQQVIVGSAVQRSGDRLDLPLV